MAGLQVWKKHRVSILGGAAVAAALVVGGINLASGMDAGPAAAPPPAVGVGVRTVEPQAVRLWSDFSGRLQAVDAADIRPEVSGRITDIRFRDGQSVKAGDVLFVIDPRPYAAAVEKAKADLASAKTNVALANVEFARAQRLIKQQAVAQSVFDQRANARHVAIAAKDAAEAELRQAEVDLDHAYVKAPISGRVSRAEITLGNLVQAGANAPLLTSIVSNDGIYADFEVDEQTYMRAIRAANGAPGTIAVQLTVPGAAGARAYKGTLDSFDNKIDPSTGTIRARARFANSDGSLVPGMFVSVRMASGFDRNALLVPARAISSDQSKSFIYVVGQGGKAQFRSVRLGSEVGGQRIITAGLKPGERVIVDGIQHVAPGAPVEIQQASL